jgi:hypothetical protein
MYLNNRHIAIALMIIVASCNDGNKTSDIIEAGKNQYYNACLSCHLKGKNTLDHPSLEEMSKYDKTVLKKYFNQFNTDSFHLGLLPENYNTDSLVMYIKSYTKQDVIPGDK